MPLIHHPHYSERVPDAAPRRPPPVSTRARATVDTEQQFFSSLLTASITAPLSADEQWSALDLDAQTLSRMSPSRLLELLADLSPEVSKALWDFLRFANAGWTATAMRPSGKMPGTAAHQKALDDFLTVLKDRYGSVDVIIGRLFMGAFLRGALFAELVLDDSKTRPLDIATPDPATARWHKTLDPDLGVVNQLGQYQGGTFVALDYPTVRYLPVDPFPSRPDGRALAAPALFSAVFQLSMLHDIRRVVQQQGYPRIDIAIILEKLIAAMPPSERSNTAKIKEWVEDTIRDVEEHYSALEPSDAYVHTDDVQVNRPVGTLDTASLGAVATIIEALERMETRGLKTMPLLMATNQSSSETQSTREYEAYIGSIKAIQHLVEGLLEHLLTLALRAQGIPAIVQWRFAEVRAAELIRDATTESMQIANASAKYAAGWIDQETASLEITGHPPDVDAPRTSGNASAVDVSLSTGDNGGQQ